MGKLDEKARLAKEYWLFAAIRQNELESVRGLLDADPTLVDIPAPKRPLDTRFLSPLQVALCTGWHRDIAWLLLERGADVNYRAPKELCGDAYPVLFDAVNTAIWNARRYEWDGTDIDHIVWKHTKEEADEAFRFLQRMLELGADADQTDHYGRNALMEAVSEASKLCPNVNAETGEDYPGRIITPETRKDFLRVFQALIDAGADKENRSTFSGKTIREHYEKEPVWRVCGELFR